MLDYSTMQAEYVIYMFCAFILLWISFYLINKLRDVMSKSWADDMLIHHATGSVIDLGFQLYNLTAITDRLAPGYVYVVKSDSGHYKIGRTKDHRDRARTFNVKLPVEIEFLVLIQTGNMNKLESLLHLMFKHKRVNGEWFNLSDTDLIWLKNYPGNILTATEEDTEPVAQPA